MTRYSRLGRSLLHRRFIRSWRLDQPAPMVFRMHSPTPGPRRRPLPWSESADTTGPKPPRGQGRDMARTLVRGGIAVIACLAAVSAAACTAANPKNNNSKTPDTLHAVMSEEADNLNPLVATEQGKSQILSVIATPALYIDPNSKPASRVLASWSQTPDLKTVTLTL